MPDSIHPEALIQIAGLVPLTDRALADSVARSGSWLACRPGCSQCCHGVFAISLLDAHRLRTGLAALFSSDPVLAAAIRSRAEASLARLLPDFPGNTATGELGNTPAAREAFEDFANEEPCPALDPATQTCDLYAHRPILCRTFGPPLVTPDGGLAVCELCFDGASPAEIERCQLDPSILQAEAEANHAFNADLTSNPSPPSGESRQTIIAFALVRPVT